MVQDLDENDEPILQQATDLNEESKSAEKKSSSKTKTMAKHFFSEVKSNAKSITSIGAFVATVNSTVHKIHRMSTMNKDEFQDKTNQIEKEQKTIIQLLSFTLRSMEDLMSKHNRAISKEKCSLVFDYCRFANILTSHFRKIIDESK